MSVVLVLLGQTGEGGMVKEEGSRRCTASGPGEGGGIKEGGGVRWLINTDPPINRVNEGGLILSDILTIPL